MLLSFFLGVLSLLRVARAIDKGMMQQVRVTVYVPKHDTATVGAEYIPRSSVQCSLNPTTLYLLLQYYNLNTNCKEELPAQIGSAYKTAGVWQSCVVYNMVARAIFLNEW